MEPLKCPFCGKDPVVTSSDGGHEDGVIRGWRIECMNMFCFARPNVTALVALDRITEMWNTRKGK